MTAFVDVHCHLCAGLDDGPATLLDAESMCRSAAELGTSVIAATAHQLGHYSQNSRTTILAAVTQLAAHLQKQQINIRIIPSAEWMVDSHWIDRFDELLPELLTINDNRRYALIEFPSHPPHHTDLIARMLGDRGICPILAHIDRYAGLFADSRRVRQLQREGFVLQVNADTVDGRRGKKLQKRARQLVTAGLVHLVASDGHDPTRRTPHLRDAFHTVSRWGGSELGKLLFEQNPLAILEGQSITLAPQIGIGTRLREQFERRLRKWFP